MAKVPAVDASDVRARRGRSARNKGKNGEREIIALLQPVVNQVFVAHEQEPPLLQRNTLQSDKGGCDIHGLEWFAPEVKFQESQAVNTWWQQTVEQAGARTVPVLFYRRSHGDWQVRMYGTLCHGCTVVVTVDMNAFLIWFRIVLTREVQRYAKQQ